MNVNLRSLIGRLNDETRNAVESAAGLCLSRTHYDVEVEHYLLKLLDATDADLSLILRHFDVNRSRLAADLAASLDRLKSGNARTPSLSPSLVKMLSEAWTLGSLDFGASQIRSGHTILALVANEELFITNVTEKLLTYALGRTLDHRDMPTVRAIVRRAAQEQNRFSALVMAVVQSPAFGQRQEEH